MPEYTYYDIIAPKDILTGCVKKKDIIGKKGWFFDSLPRVINPDQFRYGVLTDTEEDSALPFKDDNNIVWLYFLPEKEPSYEERQAEWVKANNLKEGDKVKILKAYGGDDHGFDILMAERMKPLVGKVVTVRTIESDAICLWNEDKSGSWYWPYFVLEKVKDKPELKVGDCVKIIKKLNGFVGGAVPAIWKTGIIENIRDAGFKVRLDNGNFWWYVRDDLELIDKSEFIPFDLSKEEDRNALRGKWLRDIKTGNEFFVSAIITEEHGEYSDKYVHLVKGGKRRPYTLLSDYEFLDGRPVGKLANNQQMK